MGRVSIWGRGDKLTIDLLNKIKLKGTWLELAAGDGRYTLRLLRKANKVIAIDTNKNLLKEIIKKVPENHKNKLEIYCLDITKRFPFKKEYCDGIFCTGTLYLFKEKELKSIFSEINRILKPKRRLIIDFATDIKRTFNKKRSTKEYIMNSGSKNIKYAKSLLKDLLRGYKTKVYAGRFEDDLRDVHGYNYLVKGKFLLISAKKKE